VKQLLTFRTIGWFSIAVVTITAGRDFLSAILVALNSLMPGNVPAG